jgi:hypothetical protein
MPVVGELFYGVEWSASRDANLWREPDDESDREASPAPLLSAISAQMAHYADNVRTASQEPLSLHNAKVYICIKRKVKQFFGFC